MNSMLIILLVVVFIFALVNQYKLESLKDQKKRDNTIIAHLIKESADKDEQIEKLINTVKSYERK